jgi:hypothetical protein
MEHKENPCVEWRRGCRTRLAEKKSKQPTLIMAAIIFKTQRGNIICI